MDGLIPTVYKAIKKSNTRRRYKCISTKTAAVSQTVNIEDFYDIDDKIQRYLRGRQVLDDGVVVDRGGRQQLQEHRRHQSFGGGYADNGSATGYLSNGLDQFDGRRNSWPDQKEEGRVLRNCKSSRLFTCLTGA